MKLGQLIYTSCRVGLGAGAGLQTQAVSPNVTPEERYDVESLPAYETPRLPTNSSASDISRLCPPEFRYTRFESGTSALTRLAYVGADYSGRDGNFIAHSLIIPDSGVDIYPIDLIGWNGWRSKVSDQPPSLAAVELNDISRSQLSLFELSNFVKRRATNVDRLANMIHACLVSRREYRTVVIRDGPDDLATWIACLSKLLPKNIDIPIQFSTFSNSLSPNLDIQCTTEFSEFDLSSDVFDRQAFVFDFCESRFSTLDEQPCGFATSASNWLINDPGEVSVFTSFVEELDGRFPITQLPEIFECYESVMLGCRAVPVGHVNLLFDLALKSRTSQQMMVDKLTNAVQERSENDQLLDRASAAGSLINYCAGLSPKCQDAVKACVKNLLWHDLRFDSGQWHSIDELVRSFGDITVTADDVETLEHVLEKRAEHGRPLDAVFELLMGRVDKFEQSAASSYTPVLRLVRHAVRLVGPQTPIETVLNLAADRSLEELAWLGNELSGNDYTRESVNHVGSALAGILDSKLSAKSDRFYTILAKHGWQHLIVAEMNYRRKLAGNKNITGFLKRLGLIFAKVHDQPAREIRNILVSLWQESDDEVQQQVANWLIKQPKILAEVDVGLCSEVVDCLGSMVPIDPKSRKNANLAKRIESTRDRLQLEGPVQLQLRAVMRDLDSSQNIDQAQKAWQRSRMVVPPEYGEDMSRLLLRCLMPLCHNPREHWLAVNWCRSIVGEHNILCAYQHFISSNEIHALQRESGSAYALAALGFDRVHAPNQSFLNSASAQLDSWLCSVNDRTFEKVRADVLERIPLKNEKREWQRRCKAIKKTRGTVWGTLTRWIGLRTAPRRGRPQ